MLTVGINHYLFLSCVLFGLGLIAVITKRNPTMMLTGAILILNSACVNFIAFGKYSHLNFDGQAISFLIIMMTLAEVVLLSAIIFHIYKSGTKITEL